MSASTILATINAILSSVALSCATIGYISIRRGRVERHRAFMVSAVAASGVFLVCFVLRYVFYGVADFNGVGLARLGFLSVLVSHESLSVPTVPLVLVTAFLGITGRRAVHRELARMTFPIWAYVMATGLVVYVLLYIWPGRP